MAMAIYVDVSDFLFSRLSGIVFWVLWCLQYVKSGFFLVFLVFVWFSGFLLLCLYLYYHIERCNTLEVSVRFLFFVRG